MPWSNQSGGGGAGGGGWKGGSGGPWGQRPSGGGGPGQQPDLEEILKRGQDRLKQALPGGNLPGPLIMAIAAIGVGVIGFLGFTFIVAPDEVGLVLRFGKYVRREFPGLHMRLPYPIEEVRRPKVENLNNIEIGAPGGRDGARESLMLTGDENIVDVDFIVFWKIDDAVSYEFNVRKPENTVRDVAESAMREIVGKSNVQDILAEKRAETEMAAQELMQKTLNHYKAGIKVTQVQLQRVSAPDKVIDAFRDVQAAKADRERAQNEAQAYANTVIPRAKGDSERIRQAAQGYREQAVNEATGQAARFSKVYEEYKKSPEVIRKRIYLETMERVLGDMDKVIVDTKGGAGVVPYLPLGDFTKPKTPGGQ